MVWTKRIGKKKDMLLSTRVLTDRQMAESEVFNETISNADYAHRMLGRLRVQLRDKMNKYMFIVMSIVAVLVLVLFGFGRSCGVLTKVVFVAVAAISGVVLAMWSAAKSGQADTMRHANEFVVNEGLKSSEIVARANSAEKKYLSNIEAGRLSTQGPTMYPMQRQPMYPPKPMYTTQQRPAMYPT